MYANFKANSGGMWDDSNGGWAMPIYAAGDGWWAYSEFTSDECRHQGNRLYDFNWAGAWDTFMTYTTVSYTHLPFTVVLGVNINF